MARATASKTLKKSKKVLRQKLQEKRFLAVQKKKKSKIEAESSEDQDLASGSESEENFISQKIDHSPKKAKVLIKKNETDESGNSEEESESKFIPLKSNNSPKKSKVLKKKDETNESEDDNSSEEKISIVSPKKGSKESKPVDKDVLPEQSRESSNKLKNEQKFISADKLTKAEKSKMFKKMVVKDGIISTVYAPRLTKEELKKQYEDKVNTEVSQKSVTKFVRSNDLKDSKQVQAENSPNASEESEEDDSDLSDASEDDLDADVTQNSPDASEESEENEAQNLSNASEESEENESQNLSAASEDESEEDEVQNSPHGSEDESDKDDAQNSSDASEDSEEDAVPILKPASKSLLKNLKKKSNLGLDDDTESQQPIKKKQKDLKTLKTEPVKANPMKKKQLLTESLDASKKRKNKLETKHEETHQTSPVKRIKKSNSTKDEDLLTKPLTSQNPKAKKVQNKDSEKQSDKDSRNTIFVGNLPVTTTRKELTQLFQKFKPTSCRIRGVVPSKEQISKKVAAIKGKFHEGLQSVVGYVVFDSAEHAKAALSLNGTEFKDHHLSVNEATPKGVKKDYDRQYTVFVGNLPFDIGDESVFSAFSRFGQIASVRVIRDRETGAGKGFGYVQFQSKTAKKKAILCTDMEIKENKIRIQQLRDNKKAFMAKKFGRKPKPKKFVSKKDDGLSKEKKSVKKTIKDQKAKRMKKRIAQGFKAVMKE